METTKCNIQFGNMKDDCCNMDDTHKSNSLQKNSTCDTTFDLTGCMLINNLSTTNNYVVPQGFNLEQYFSIITIIDEHTNNFKLLTENTLIIASVNSPPIYVCVQSFLI